MNAATLVADLRPRGVVFLIESGKLKWRAPIGILTEADNQVIRDHKVEIIELLAAPDIWSEEKARLFDAASRRPWKPTLAWSDVPPGAIVPIWAEEWKQPDGTSWARAPQSCVSETKPDRALAFRELSSDSTKVADLEELKALASNPVRPSKGR